MCKLKTTPCVKKKSKTEMTANVQLKETNQNTQEFKNERYLIRTRQNNVHIFGKFCLRHSDIRTEQMKHETVSK